MARIALIEDVEPNRLLIVKILEHTGHEVLVAEDGHRGLDLVKRELPDIVLMDLSLPGVDGYEVLEKLRSDEATRGIRIVALTAHAMAGDRERVLRAGFDHYIAKPVEVEAFLREIASFCEPRP